MPEVIKEYPIIFSTELVKAILDGRKTMTRRVIKPQTPEDVGVFFWFAPEIKGDKAPEGCWYEDDNGLKFHCKCPYGQVGDKLWCKETWYQDISGGLVCYKADYPVGDKDWPPSNTAGKIKPSIFMPRWASRITLEITEVRVERVQDITFDDMVAEGARYPVTADGHKPLRITGDHPPSDYIPKEDFKPQSFAYIGTEEKWLKAHFASLWDSINDKRGYGWEVNPWVWVISFKRLDDAGS